MSLNGWNMNSQECDLNPELTSNMLLCSGGHILAKPVVPFLKLWDCPLFTGSSVLLSWLAFQAFLKRISVLYWYQQYNLWYDLLSWENQWENQRYRTSLQHITAPKPKPSQQYVDLMTIKAARSDFLTALITLGKMSASSRLQLVSALPLSMQAAHCCNYTLIDACSSARRAEP